MGLVERITALWQRSRPVAAETTTPPPSRQNPALWNFGAALDRRSVVLDCRQMVNDDPRAKQSLATLARDVAKGGFAVQVNGARAAEAQAAADALIERLNLATRIDDWVKLTTRDGDSFLELGVTSDGTIAEVTRKPTLEMYRASDAYDRFGDPAKAYYWSEQVPFNDVPPANAVWFAEWQIIHARWDRDEGSRYGTPLFAAARKPYKRMTQGELDIAVRRKSRSGLRYVHALEDASLADLEAYKAANKPALDDPFAAVADLFMNKRGSIQAIQGDAHLSEIEDVLHHVDTFGLASPVPLELIGYGRNLNRDVLEQKKEQYTETLGAVRQWLVTEIIKPLLERQWLLLGIWPDALTLDVQWKTKKEPTPAELEQLGKFVATLKAMGIVTDATLLRILATALPDFDIDAELAAVAAQAAERQTELQRIAANAVMPAGDAAGDGEE
jgi:hypothetical protein